MLRELVDLFLEDCPRLLGEIHEAVRSRDSAALMRSAHALKGSVGTFGAPAAMATARELETLGRQGDLTRAEELSAQMEQEINRLWPAPAARLPQPTASS